MDDYKNINCGKTLVIWNGINFSDCTFLPGLPLNVEADA